MCGRRGGNFKGCCILQAVDELDSSGRSALHHACDWSSCCWRAMAAAKQLAIITPAEIINSPIGSRKAFMWTCLHLTCDGSDKGFQRANLCQLLIDRRADLELHDDKGNTPWLVGVGTGAVDTMRVLLRNNVNTRACNNDGTGARQKCQGSSTEMRKLVESTDAPETNTVRPPRQRGDHINDSRRSRYSRNEHWSTSRREHWKSW